MAAVGLVIVTSAAAGNLRDGAEGFSASPAGLPGPASGAWRATVLIEVNSISWETGERPKRRIVRGSGVVVSIDPDDRTAIVATNAHVVDCGQVQCGLRVGVGSSARPEDHVWTDEVGVAWIDAARDLAFLEIAMVPEGTVEAARLSVGACGAFDASPVLAIGWPDLGLRTVWGVPPPANHSVHLKRYSQGWVRARLRGYRMRPAVDRLMERIQVLFHNADVLPGSSGGPLVNERGEVVAINTMIVGSGARPDHNHYCARLDPHRPGKDCVHVAITTDEVVHQYEQAFESRLQVASCADRPRESRLSDGSRSETHELPAPSR